MISISPARQLGKEGKGVSTDCEVAPCVRVRRPLRDRAVEAERPLERVLGPLAHGGLEVEEHQSGVDGDGEGHEGSCGISWSTVSLQDISWRS